MATFIGNENTHIRVEDRKLILVNGRYNVTGKPNPDNEYVVTEDELKLIVSMASPEFDMLDAGGHNDK